MVAKNKRSAQAMIRHLDGVIGHKLVGVRQLALRPVARARSERHVVAIELDLEERKICFVVNSHWDTIEIATISPMVDSATRWVNSTEDLPWSKWLHKPLKFGWIWINNRGYIDGVSLGFDAYNPSISMISISHSIEEYELSYSFRLRKVHSSDRLRKGSNR